MKGLDKSEQMMYNSGRVNGKEEEERYRQSLKLLTKEFFGDNRTRTYRMVEQAKRSTSD